MVCGEQLLRIVVQITPFSTLIIIMLALNPADFIVHPLKGSRLFALFFFLYTVIFCPKMTPMSSIKYRSVIFGPICDANLFKWCKASSFNKKEGKKGSQRQRENKSNVKKKAEKLDSRM